MAVTGAPATREELAEALKEAAGAGEPVRFTGGGTKRGWGATGPDRALELPTAGLDRILEHNAGDLTERVVYLGKLSMAVLRAEGGANE